MGTMPEVTRGEEVGSSQKKALTKLDRPVSELILLKKCPR